MTREQFLKKIRQEIPYIKAFEEDDWDWYNEGIELVERGEFERAKLAWPDPKYPGYPRI